MAGYRSLTGLLNRSVLVLPFEVMLGCFASACRLLPGLLVYCVRL